MTQGHDKGPVEATTLSAGLLHFSLSKNATGSGND